MVAQERHYYSEDDHDEGLEDDIVRPPLVPRGDDVRVIEIKQQASDGQFHRSLPQPFVLLDEIVDDAAVAERYHQGDEQEDDHHDVVHPPSHIVRGMKEEDADQDREVAHDLDDAQDEPVLAELNPLREPDTFVREHAQAHTRETSEQTLLHHPVDEVVGCADGVRFREDDYQQQYGDDRRRVPGEVGIEPPQQEPDDRGTNHQRGEIPYQFVAVESQHTDQEHVLHLEPCRCEEMVEPAGVVVGDGSADDGVDHHGEYQVREEGHQFVGAVTDHPDLVSLVPVPAVGVDHHVPGDDEEEIHRQVTVDVELCPHQDVMEHDDECEEHPEDIDGYVPCHSGAKWCTSFIRLKGLLREFIGLFHIYQKAHVLL